jgi:hypothetical protein
MDWIFSSSNWPMSAIHPNKHDATHSIDDKTTGIGAFRVAGDIDQHKAVYDIHLVKFRAKCAGLPMCKSTCKKLILLGIQFSN